MIHVAPSGPGRQNLKRFSHAHHEQACPGRPGPLDARPLARRVCWPEDQAGRFEVGGRERMPVRTRTVCTYGPDRSMSKGPTNDNPPCKFVKLVTPALQLPPAAQGTSHITQENAPSRRPRPARIPERLLRTHERQPDSPGPDRASRTSNGPSGRGKEQGTRPVWSHIPYTYKPVHVVPSLISAPALMCRGTAQARTRRDHPALRNMVERTHPENRSAAPVSISKAVSSRISGAPGTLLQNSVTARARNAAVMMNGLRMGLRRLLLLRPPNGAEASPSPVKESIQRPELIPDR